jgi:hypothetical protein
MATPPTARPFIIDLSISLSFFQTAQGRYPLMLDFRSLSWTKDVMNGYETNSMLQSGLP